MKKRNTVFQNSIVHCPTMHTDIVFYIEHISFQLVLMNIYPYDGVIWKQNTILRKNNIVFNVKFNFAGNLRYFAHCVCVFHLCVEFWEYEACFQKKCVNNWEQLESVLLTGRPSSTLRAEEVWGLQCFNTSGDFEDWLLYWFFRDYSISLTRHVRLLPVAWEIWVPFLLEKTAWALFFPINQLLNYRHSSAVQRKEGWTG